MFEPVSKFIVGHSAGIATLGLFEIAYKVVALPRNAVVSGALGITPAITRLLMSDRTEAIKLYIRAKKIVIFATGGVMLAVILGSPIISILLLKKLDWILITFIPILAIGFWLNAVGAPAYTLGFSSGKMRANLISSILSVICVVIIGNILQFWSQNFGPVVATATALSLGGFFILWRNEKLLKES